MIKRFVSVFICLMIGIFIMDLNNYAYKFLFILPILYGVLFVLVIPIFIKEKKYGPGLILLYIITFIRYVIMPILLKETYYYRDARYQPENTSLNIAILIMIVELISIALMVIIFYKIPNSNKIVAELSKEENQNRKLMLGFVLIICFIIVLRNPNVLKFFNFFLIQESTQIYTQEALNASTLQVLAISWIRVLLPVLWIKCCKEKLLKTKNDIWCYIAMIGPLLAITFFNGTSRSSIIMPAYAYTLILGKTFPKYKKRIQISIISVASIAVLSLTLFKSFGHNVNSVNSINIQWLANYLQAYFGGPHNMAIAIETKKMFINEIGIGTFLSDILGPITIIGKPFRNSLSTPELFNYKFFGSNVSFDQVIPTAGESYMFFGILGCCIFSMIIVYIICKLDFNYFKEESIELGFLYAITACQAAFNLPQNLTILLSNLYNTFIPMLILFLLNRKLVVKYNTIRGEKNGKGKYNCSSV